jgi:hypothetical protein
VDDADGTLRAVVASAAVRAEPVAADPTVAFVIVSARTGWTLASSWGQCYDFKNGFSNENLRFLLKILQFFAKIIITLFLSGGANISFRGLIVLTTNYLLGKNR